MGRLKGIQENFQTYVLQKLTDPITNDIAAPPQGTIEERLNVYSKGYLIRFIETLQGDFPALLFLLGKDEFEQLSIQYINANPSHHFSITIYGKKIPEFIHNYSQLKEKCAYSDLAKFEWALSEVLETRDGP